MEKFNLKKENPNYIKILNAQKVLFCKEDSEEIENSNENHLISLMKKKLTIKNDSHSNQSSKSDQLSAGSEQLSEILEDHVSKQKGNIAPIVKIRSSMQVENPKEKNFINELTQKFEKKKTEMVSKIKKVSVKPKTAINENKNVYQRSSALISRTASHNVIRSPPKQFFDLKKKNIIIEDSEKFSNSSKNTSNNEIENPANIPYNSPLQTIGSPVKFIRTNFFKAGLTIKEEEGLN